MSLDFTEHLTTIKEAWCREYVD